MRAKAKSGIGGSGLAIMLAIIPAFHILIPAFILIALLILSISMIFWAIAPAIIGKFKMTFGLIVILVCGIGLLFGTILHFTCPDLLTGKGEIMAEPPYGKNNMKIGKDSVVMGNVPHNLEIGEGSVVIGPTDANGNVILNQPMAVGRGAQAGPGSIAIGAGAGAGMSQPKSNKP